MPVIQRIEDLVKVSQLTTGALFYCSQSGTAFNTNPLDIINCISATNTFSPSTSLTNSGQNLYNLITGFSGDLKTYNNWNTQNLYGNSGLISVDWTNRALYDITGNPSIAWNARTFFNNWIFTSAIKSNQDGQSSIDSNPRHLVDSSGFLSILWNDRKLFGRWNINGTGIATSSELASTGTNLQNQINNLIVNAGVVGINGISGIISITGIGNIIVQSSGQTINISDGEGIKIFKTSKINFKQTGIYNLYTIPNGYFFSIDSMEIITTDVSALISPPYVEFGDNINQSGYLSLYQTSSSTIYNRDIIDSASDLIIGNTVINGTIYSGSIGTSHSGFLIYKGYLIKNQ